MTSKGNNSFCSTAKITLCFPGSEVLGRRGATVCTTPTARSALRRPECPGLPLLPNKLGLAADRKHIFHGAAACLEPAGLRKQLITHLKPCCTTLDLFPASEHPNHRYVLPQFFPSSDLLKASPHWMSTSYIGFYLQVVQRHQNRGCWVLGLFVVSSFRTQVEQR